MKTSLNIEIARETWIKSSKEFNFIIETPYIININGVLKEVFAFLPEYGSPNGMLVGLMSAPNYDTDRDILKWVRKHNYFCSFVAIEAFFVYDRDYFIECLEDWGKFK